MSRKYFNCTSSSIQTDESDCRKVFNSRQDEIWSDDGESEASWFNVEFNQPYNLSKVQIKGTVANVTLTFSDNTLEKNISTEGNDWKTIELASLKFTKSLNISIPETSNAKISEIRFYGCPGIILFLTK